MDFRAKDDDRPVPPDECAVIHFESDIVAAWRHQDAKRFLLRHRWIATNATL